MKYGYYVAAKNTEHGDPALSASCRERWETLGGGFKSAQAYDGVSAWTDERGWHVRILCRDFFAQKFSVAQAMVTP